LQRVRLRLRGLGFQWRDESEISARDLARIDVCWHTAVGLAVADHIRGNAFQTQGLLLALRAGEPYRLARALAVEAAYASGQGGPAARRVEDILRVAAELANKVGSAHALALITGVRGQAALLSGRLRDGMELSAQAEQLFREKCIGVPWEIATARLWRFRSMLHLGRLAELSRLLPTAFEECRDRGDLYSAASLGASVAPILRLTAGDPEGARASVHDALERWSAHGFHVQHYFALYALTSAHLYQGNGAAAVETVEARWRELERSLLLRVQFVKIVMLDVRARAHVQAAAALTGKERARQTRLAAKHVRMLAHEKMPWGNALAAQHQAGLAMLAGDRERAASWQKQAMEGFASAEMALHAAIARRRAGQLAGGEAGDALIAAGDAWLRDERVADPDRMTALLAPGFPD
jgi:eukaryotic-like serine/threonine-protein kinase